MRQTKSPRHVLFPSGAYVNAYGGRAPTARAGCGRRAFHLRSRELPGCYAASAEVKSLTPVCRSARGGPPQITTSGQRSAAFGETSVPASIRT